MAYFMLVIGKQGICRGASSYRNNAGWHELTDLARPLSGSGYQYSGRDELSRLVEAKMVSEARGRQIAALLDATELCSGWRSRPPTTERRKAGGPSSM
jgi:hypothetical protein